MTINILIDEYLRWLKDTCEEDSTRKWCMLGFGTPSKRVELNQSEIRKYFERVDINKKYVERYNNRDIPTKETYAFLQLEIDMIYGFHKSFVARHKTRLQYYRDDCAMKRYHTWNAIALSFGKFLSDKNIAERPDFEKSMSPLSKDMAPEDTRPLSNDIAPADTRPLSNIMTRPTFGKSKDTGWE